MLVRQALLRKRAWQGPLLIVVLTAYAGASTIVQQKDEVILKAQTPESGGNAPRVDSASNNISTDLTAPPLEVLSVKQNKSNMSMATMGVTDDGIRVTNMSLLFIIHAAFAGHFTNGTIQGLPGWEMTRYDVEGKVSDSDAGKLRNLNQQQKIEMTRAMLREVLVDRFHMAYRYVDKDGPVYRLVVAKGGPKLKAATPDEKDSGVDQRGAIRAAMSMRGFANALSGPITGRVVIDDTELQGKYHVVLTWTPDLRNQEGEGRDANVPPPAPGSGPSIFTAVEEQLGLKLLPGRGPVKSVVIDRIERPTAN
jgi:uncharacterized protein (TIGR03435 family)